ncbi:MAG: STAS domain-containing protein [Leptospiraceae bacterium]|nr:STAS domain-containing protein [Leptospiraceae bacterium]
MAVPTDRSLSYTIQDAEGYSILLVSGDLNMFTAPELRNALVKKFEGGIRRFIIDLTNLSYIDSSGIGILVSFVSMARRQENSRVILCGLNKQIRSIFEVTRLLSIFEVMPDLAAAEQEMRR